MRVSKIFLEGFRGYLEPTEFPIEQDLTVFLGRNDAGKSTIFEALDLFFEGKIKAEQADLSKGRKEETFIIGVQFSSFPKELSLDSGGKTTLEKEYLLNDGKLEIFKRFNAKLKTPTAKIFAKAIHPINPKCTDLLSRSRDELRVLIAEYKLEDDCNRNEKASMRNALYKHFGEKKLDLKQTEVNLDKEDGKSVWTSLKDYSFPIYQMFKSDRLGGESDNEIKEPVDIALQAALSPHIPKLKEIEEDIRKQVEQITNETLEHLQKNYPDIAAKLKPKFGEPKWKDVFKWTIEDEEEIPIRKKGSGVRRLYLLSFFQAMAEKKRTESSADERPIIYAIEEPESFQHPDNVELILENLKTLSSGKDQVLISSHLPNLVARTKIDSIRLIKKNKNSDGKLISTIHSSDDTTLKQVALTLGLYPEIRGDVFGAKIIICVEDLNDSYAYKELLKKVSSHRRIALDLDKVVWFRGGGNELHAWLERANLENIDLPKVIFMDSDKLSKGDEPKESNAKIVEDAEQMGWLGFLTKKREIENYLNPKTLVRLAPNSWHENRVFDPDFHDWQRENLQACRQEIRNNLPDDEKEELMRKYKTKMFICRYLIREMTLDETLEISLYKENDDSEESCEITEWVEKIAEKIN